jgi:ribosome-binding protein aMBF1 (putative translation factor)
MTTKAQRRKTVTVNGRRFVLVAEDEWKRLQRLSADTQAHNRQAPALPPADARGNRPAAAYIQASIARSIYRQRTSLGLSQLDVARMANVRQETVCRLESGKHAPTVRTVERIERALERARAKMKRK